MAKCSGFLLKLVAFAFLCMIANFPQYGEAAVNCKSVLGKLASCVPYIYSGIVKPGKTGTCCLNVRSFVKTAKTGSLADRRATCGCLKKITNSRNNAQISRASKLPGICGTIAPFPISRSVDCSRVK